jgi:formyl-CoA transferase
MGRTELVDDPDFTGNQARVKNRTALDDMIGAWTATMTAVEADRVLSEADIPCCQVYTVADCAADPQYRHRGMVQEVDDPLFGTVLQTGIVPIVPEDPGRVRWPGPAIGAHTEAVLTSLLGLTADEVSALRAEGVV